VAYTRIISHVRPSRGDNAEDANSSSWFLRRPAQGCLPSGLQFTRVQHSAVGSGQNRPVPVSRATLELALARLRFPCGPWPALAAGAPDSGVHCAGQVVSFRRHGPDPRPALGRRALNGPLAAHGSASAPPPRFCHFQLACFVYCGPTYRAATATPSITAARPIFSLAPLQLGTLRFRLKRAGDGRSRLEGLLRHHRPFSTFRNSGSPGGCIPATSGPGGGLWEAALWWI